MAIYGYHRTSTADQHLDRGVKAINEYCNNNNIKLTEMFTDQKTGKNFNRPDYLALKRIAKNKDDVIIISEVDRLGRNKYETLKELQHYKNLGVRLMILEIPTTLVDYSTMDNSLATMLMETINNMLIEMYATIAHAEMVKKEKRQAEGLQAMKERGQWDRYGRPAAIDYEVFKIEYNRVLTAQIKPTELMQELGMAKSTYYKYARKVKDDLEAQGVSI